MSDEVGDDSNLDIIFAEVGEFGIFQVIAYTLICIPTILTSTYAVNYIFSSNTLDYR